jgi:hypothetical protein
MYQCKRAPDSRDIGDDLKIQNATKWPIDNAPPGVFIQFIHFIQFIYSCRLADVEHMLVQSTNQYKTKHEPTGYLNIRNVPELKYSWPNGSRWKQINVFENKMRTWLSPVLDLISFLTQFSPSTYFFLRPISMLLTKKKYKVSSLFREKKTHLLPNLWTNVVTVNKLIFTEVLRKLGLFVTKHVTLVVNVCKRKREIEYSRLANIQNIWIFITWKHEYS